MRHPALAVGILVSRYVVVIALAVLVTARPSAVSPSTRYRIIDLGAVTADRYSVASGVNDRGQVVGRRSPCELDRPCSSTAVLFEKGTMIDLVTPAGYETAAISASDINSRGQSVGCMYAFRSDQLRPAPLGARHRYAIGGADRRLRGLRRWY